MIGQLLSWTSSDSGWICPVCTLCHPMSHTLVGLQVPSSKDWCFSNLQMNFLWVLTGDTGLLWLLCLPSFIAAFSEIVLDISGMLLDACSDNFLLWLCFGWLCCFAEEVFADVPVMTSSSTSFTIPCSSCSVLLENQHQLAYTQLHR
mgnify:CR=1 FL=1